MCVQMIQIGLVMINLCQVTNVQTWEDNQCTISFGENRWVDIEDDKDCQKTFKAIKEAK